MESRAARVSLLLLLCLGGALAAPELVNEEVKRTVDLGTHLAKVTAELSLANPAGGSGSAASFLLALDPGLESHLAYLGVQVSELLAGRAASAAFRFRSPSRRASCLGAP